MADTNSILYKIGQAVKQQISDGTSDLSNKADSANSSLTGTTSAENVNVSQDLTVSGNLQVLGEQTVTKINQTDLDISDNFIGLNRGASAAANNTKDIGLYFERGSSESAGAIVFDETNDKFVVGYIAAGAAGGYELTVSTADGDYKVNLSGDVIDAYLAAVNTENAFNTIQFSVATGTADNAMGLAQPETQIELQIIHPAASGAESGPWMDGFSSDAEAVAAINSLDYSATEEANTGQFKIHVVPGNGPWDANHAVKAYIVEGGNSNFSYELTTGVSDNLDSAITSFTDGSLTALAGQEVAGGAADASSTTAATTAAPLKVGSLEIADSVLGDLADFNAGLTA